MNSLIQNKLKKYLKSLIISLILSIITTCIILMPPKINADASQISGQVVIEKNTKRVLFENKANVKMPMASTTKIVTAITVIENSELDQEVVIPKAAVGVEGSSIYLREGEKLTVLDLLYGLMLRSGNDAAVALSLHVGKNIEGFAKLMNDMAKKCGAHNSNFANPHGLTHPDHYTTCYDLAVITAYALSNPVFSEICSTKKIKCGDRVFVNKNKMLNNYEGCNGVKTGYTVNAGRCLVTSAERNGMQLISVVLNCYDMYERSAKILDDGFADYKMQKILSKGTIVKELPISNGMVNGETLPVILNDDIVLPLADNEFKHITYSFEGCKELNFPIKKGEYLGDLSVFIDKDLIFSLKLYTILQINKYNVEQILEGIFVRW